MMVICHGEQLRQALHLLQEVTEWSIVGQLARVNVGHLEEREVASHLYRVEEILFLLERRGLSPRSTHPAELGSEISDKDLS